MTHSNYPLALAATLAMAIATVGCGNGDDPASTTGLPTGPTAVETPAANGPGAAIGDPLAVFIQSGDPWSYLDDGSDQGTQWRQRSFNDSAWPNAGAEFGYGDDDEVTLINFGPDASSKFITTYFRKTFRVNDVASHASVVLDMIVDDGAVVYVNGIEVFRTNMPGGAIGSTTLAAGPIENENIVVSTDIDPNVLVNGDNVIAVEVHQAAPDSTDLSFNLALRDGERSAQPDF